MIGDQQPSGSSHNLHQKLDLDFALRAAGLGVWEVDPTTNLVIWDDQCRALFGLAKDNPLSYDQAIQYIHPDDVGSVNEAVQWAMNPQSDGAYDQTYRTIGADDGKLRWVRFIGKSYFHPDGQLDRFAGVAQDVTPQMEAQQALQESEQRALLLADALPQAIWVTDPVGNVEFLNKWWADYSGVLVNPSTAWQVANDSLHPEDAPRLMATFRQAIQQGKGFAIEQRNRSASGEYHWFLNVGEPYRDPKTGQITKWVGMSVDIDDRKEAEAALQVSEQRFRLFVTASSDVVYTMSADWRQMNQLEGKTFLADTREPSRDWLLKYVPAEDQLLVEAAIEAAIVGKRVFELEHRVIQANGQIGWILSRAVPILDPAGQIIEWFGTASDVTQRKQAEAALRQSEERYRNLSAELDQRVQDRTQALTQANQDLKRSNDNLQQFAYVASHDLQEPLRKIQSFGTLLSQQFDNQLNAAARDHLQRITAAGNRMSTLIKDLLAYSRISTRQQDFGPVSLESIVADVLTTLEWAIRQSGAQISVEALPVVKGDHSQLGQLFQNLVSNAIKFVAPGQVPHIQITYFQRLLSELPAGVRPSVEAPTYHQIDVIDQGIGFDEKHANRIFEVFQRLHGKSEYAGTGVGLAICQRVVENHGGAITASSQVGRGACFSIYLPA